MNKRIRKKKLKMYLDKLAAMNKLQTMSDIAIRTAAKPYLTPVDNG